MIEKRRGFMAKSKYANKGLAARFALVLFACALLLTAALMLAGVRLKPIDVSSCKKPLDTLSFGVDKFENEGTVLVSGWAFDSARNYDSFCTVAVIKDTATGKYYEIPTATRTAESDGDDELPTGFFARGLSLFNRVGEGELFLIYSDGLNRYLIDTDLTA